MPRPARPVVRGAEVGAAMAMTTDELRALVKPALEREKRGFPLTRAEAAALAELRVRVMGQ